MTTSEFALCMAKLSAAYRERLEQSTVEVYYAVLGAYDRCELDHAILEVIEDLPRFPTVADLRIRVQRIRRDANASRSRLPPPSEPLPIKEMVAELKSKMGWS